MEPRKKIIIAGVLISIASLILLVYMLIEILLHFTTGWIITWWGWYIFVSMLATGLTMIVYNSVKD